MTQEDKNLILNDLCVRLQYGVHIWTNDKKHLKLWGIEQDDIGVYWVNGVYGIDEVKPYLRSMSSMPEEEFEYLVKLGVENSLKCIEIDDPKESFSLATKLCVEQLGYLYEHHYDVNGLIPSGLAIEVTEENNPYKD